MFNLEKHSYNHGMYPRFVILHSVLSRVVIILSVLMNFVFKFNLHVILSGRQLIAKQIR